MGSIIALAIYNQGILNAKLKNFKDSRENIESCIETANKLTKKENLCSCLIIPKIFNNKIVFEEDRNNPNLSIIAMKALKNIDLFINKSN